MIGLLLISHGRFGESLIENVCHILGKTQPLLMSLDVCGQDRPEAIQAAARQMVAELDRGQGVLILTDIFGATPSNIASSLFESGRVESVAGVNLPMLLRALCYREKEMAMLIEKVVSGGKESIINLSQSNHGEKNAS